jgi:DNA polymerase I-like protein with 3'-5' exonuclease and polymerase domains
MESMLSTHKSCIVNSVHDSVVIDIHPTEIQQVLYVIKKLNTDLKAIIEQQFKIQFNVPLLLEAKIGDNWLDTKDVA